MNRHERSRFVSKMTIPDKRMRFGDLAPYFCRVMNWPETTPVKLFEEIRIHMTEALNFKKSPDMSDMCDGDIICVQRELTEEEYIFSCLWISDSFVRIEQLSHPDFKDAIAYYEYLYSKVIVRMYERTNPKGDYAELFVSKKSSYDLVRFPFISRSLTW